MAISDDSKSLVLGCAFFLLIPIFLVLAYFLGSFAITSESAITKILSLAGVLGFLGIVAFFSEFMRAWFSAILFTGGVGLIALAIEDQGNLLGIFFGLVTIGIAYFLSQTLKDEEDPWK